MPWPMAERPRLAGPSLGGTEPVKALRPASHSAPSPKSRAVLWSSSSPYLSANPMKAVLHEWEKFWSRLVSPRTSSPASPITWPPALISAGQLTIDSGVRPRRMAARAVMTFMVEPGATWPLKAMFWALPVGPVAAARISPVLARTATRALSRSSPARASSAACSAARSSVSLTVPPGPAGMVWSVSTAGGTGSAFGSVVVVWPRGLRRGPCDPDLQAGRPLQSARRSGPGPRTGR